MIYASGAVLSARRKESIIIKWDYEWNTEAEVEATRVRLQKTYRMEAHFIYIRNRKEMDMISTINNC
jgi:hypothetical protein